MLDSDIEARDVARPQLGPSGAPAVLDARWRVADAGGSDEMVRGTEVPR